MYNECIWIYYWTVSNDTRIPHTSPYLTCILVYNCPVSSLRLQRLQWYRRPNEILLAQRKNVPTPAKILATTCMVVHTARHASRTTFSLLTHTHKQKKTDTFKTTASFTIAAGNNEISAEPVHWETWADVQHRRQPVHTCLHMDGLCTFLGLLIWCQARYWDFVSLQAVTAL